MVAGTFLLLLGISLLGTLLRALGSLISTHDKTLSFTLEVKGSNITEVSFNLLNLFCRLFSRARQNYWFPVNWMRNSKMEDCFVSVFLLFLTQIHKFFLAKRRTLF